MLVKDIELIIGNDLGFVPETPATPYGKSGSQRSEQILLDMANKLGHCVSYAQEQQGQLIQNIVPVFKTESQQISTSSRVELALHTETAFHPYKPDYILLLCLRGDKKAVTTYALVDEIISKLELWVIATLQKEWFTTGIDISFRTNGEKDKKIPITILKKNKENDYQMIYDLTLVQGINDIAREALVELEKAIALSIHNVVLETGDLLIINNNKAIHGRKPFQARYDGTDRWVQRMLVRENLPSKDQIDGNVIITKFG